MTVERAQEIFEAMGECYRRKISPWEHCDDCDNCALMYAQGTMGEIRDACNLVTRILQSYSDDYCDHCIYKMEADDE